MSEELALEWVNRIEAKSGVYADFLFTQPTDNTFGWRERLETQLTGIVENLERPAGLLITGPEGCGRHTVMIHALKLLCDDYQQFAAVFLTAEDLEDDTGNFDLAQQKMETLFAKYRDQAAEDRKLFLVVDEIDDYPFRSALLKFLEKTVCEYRLEKEQEAELFLVLFQNTPFRVPAVMKGLLYPCSMVYPDRAHRQHFVEDYTEDMYKALPMEMLLDETEGYSYAELLAMVKNAQTMFLQTEEKLSEKTMKALLEERQMPVKAESEKERLFQKIEKALDSLPELLEKLGQNVGNTGLSSMQRTRLPIEEEKNENDIIEEKRAMYEKMCGRELALTYLGEKRVNELKAAYEKQNEMSE